MFLGLLATGWDSPGGCVTMLTTAAPPCLRTVRRLRGTLSVLGRPDGLVELREL